MGAPNQRLMANPIPPKFIRMKVISQLFLIIYLLVGCKPSPADKGTETQKPDNLALDSSASVYDEQKAMAYGADQYGMRTYVMAFLKKGPNQAKDSLESVRLMRAHLNNIGRLAVEGKLVVAGPFYGDQDLRGIYIFKTDNLDSARAMTESDPAIQFGSLEMELLKWYGTAALMEVNEIHKQVSREDI